ncbi:MAG: hypothetical protein IKN66_14180 [Ruminococcus sp.]|nr:hypothetical protein [Ruminococcus sp.]
MKILAIGALFLAGMLLLNGCADQSSQGSSTSTPSSVESPAAAGSSAVTSETAAAAESGAVPEYDYVHGSDGYYNLAEELSYFKMPLQHSGTCWLYAARASMETSYEKQTGKELNMEISDMLESIYGDGKQEGIIIRDSIDKANIGGFQGFVTERLSRECKDGITLTSSQMIDPTDREAIKNAVRTRGGVAVSICDKNVKKGMFGGYLTVNYDHPEEYDHYVTIIGWDDHFPKEYFKVPAAEDGAWITYNSNFDRGYYCISYCSPLDHAVSHTVSDKYSEVLSYDAGNEPDCYITTGSSAKTANVFHKKGKLAAVGTFNDFDEQDITIEIMTADFKTVLYTQKAKLDHYGYHTVELAQPVDAEDFAVAVTYSKGAPVEGESIDTAAGSYRTSAEKGQSFVFADGRWMDMTDSGTKAFIKTEKGQSVLFRDNSALKNYITDSDKEAMLGTDYAPGNCCIRALLVKDAD